MATFDRITSTPTIHNGQPTIRGMRLSVRRVIEALAVHPNWDDLRREYPELEPADLRQALAFAADQDAEARFRTLASRSDRDRALAVLDGLDRAPVS